MNKPNSSIIVRGARVHNLKNISLELPRNKLIVVTGVSGSGKSSLAFDTIYAEGQRRFVESLSTYARQFLERMEKPDVDFISGISPAIAIEQKPPAKNPRSTVGTMTEIYDYLRLLFGRIGKTYCSNCGKIVQRDSVQTVFQQLEREFDDDGEHQLFILFPLQEHPGISLSNEIENLKKQGFYRILYRNELIDLNEQSIGSKMKKSEIMVLVDRVIYRKNGEHTRTADSLELAFKASGGHVIIKVLEKNALLRFNKNYACANCMIEYEEPDPRIFSFNNPAGACPKCQGFGRSVGIDLDLVVPDKEKSIREGAIHPWTFPKWHHYLREFLDNADEIGVRVDIPFRNLSEEEIRKILNGYNGIDGVRQFFEFIEKKSYKVQYRVLLSNYRSYTTCDVCQGSRLRPEVLNIRIAHKNIFDIVRMTIERAYHFFTTLELSPTDAEISRRILEELQRRLRYLVNVGIGYLTLDRLANTLSGGESARINLSTALGSSLVGSLYVLDEPSIGLHPRDTNRLISIMNSLRDIGNTVLVVEHDAEIILSADVVVDLGPRAGELGGNVVFVGKVEDIKKCKESITGKYLGGELTIPVPEERRPPSYKKIIVRGAEEHNLKQIDIEIPLHRFVCITGVSGSGKSTFVHDILYPALLKSKGQHVERVGKHRCIEGAELIDAVELVDQTPIGKTPRSNPITYIKAFDTIREVFADTQSAKIRGFTPGTFSFNVPGGRCDACEGRGTQTIEMQFLTDIELQCEVCRGKRFKKEVLAVRYQGKNIDDILNMTVTEALQFFSRYITGKRVVKRLKVLDDVGMGYIRLGQSATTLSGGEAQRVKLAAHLANYEEGKHTLFLFDEPTTGLHFDDIMKLLNCFNALIKQGNSILIIEHNMEVIKCADWVIDLGPEAGDQGGQIVAEGTPEEIVKCKQSYTGKFLQKYLSM